MQITFTEAASKKIQDKITGKEGYLKLKYDTDGCGCVVSGVSALWLVTELAAEDKEIKTNGPAIYAEKSKLVFFDEVMTIDFSETANCFQLKSPNQYLNPRMSFLDKTK